MMMFDLSGRVRLAVHETEGPSSAALAKQLDPFKGRSVPEAADADVEIELGGHAPADPVDIQNPARDGLTTAYDGQDFSLLAGDRACTVRHSPESGLTAVRCAADFPAAHLFRSVVRPALQVAAIRRDVVAVHSASVEVAGRAILLAGWSESGKTETALAFMEDGAAWLSDKWTLLGADAQTSAFPVNVGVRRWVLPYLPRLAAALPRAARLQVAAAGAAARATQPLRRPGSPTGVLGSARVLTERAVGLVDRAALTSSEIRSAYGQADDPARRVPLGVLALLTTVPGPGISAAPAQPSWAAARLALTGAYERHDWYLLRDRQRYAVAAVRANDREEMIRAEQRLLERALNGMLVLDVRAPFPVDPRRVAAAVRGAM